jgi:leucyl aminopeptidase
MTDFSTLLKADDGQPATLLHLTDSTGFVDWLQTRSERERTLLQAMNIRGKAGEVAILPGDGPADWSVVAGVADRTQLGSWCLAKAAEQLPEGRYRLAEGEPGQGALGWLLAQHRFERYRKAEHAAGPRALLTTGLARIEPSIQMAEAVALVRDLVNTPTADMGPPHLEEIATAIAQAGSAELQVTRGDALETGYPMIHAVGRAADRSFAPRLIELQWGDRRHPRVALIGKGVCFDSGGLDIKPSSGMRLMKKDMGGAAHALALTQLVIKSRLPVRLHVLIPAVENAISGNAFRPGEILQSRKGLTVEIGNTDAEGRLILADTLTRAIEEEPELILDFATLTGAARVALGPDLPALFANDDDLAHGLSASGNAHDDPLWRLPLWDDYVDMLQSDVADIANAGDGGLAGAITAALFLKRFASDVIPWAHFDTFAWRAAAKPGRPKGGDALGLRAAFGYLQQRYSPNALKTA